MTNMENFPVKTIDFVDYVKAVDVANYLGKEKYHSAIRFIHKVFKDSDILKFNATLYVKKLAVEKYFAVDKQLVCDKLERLESEITKHRKAAEQAQKIGESVLRNYQRNIRALHEIDERTFQEILCYIHGEIPLTQFVEKKMNQIEKIFSEQS